MFKVFENLLNTTSNEIAEELIHYLNHLLFFYTNFELRVFAIYFFSFCNNYKRKSSLNLSLDYVY
jgi:hypothetical protein